MLRALLARLGLIDPPARQLELALGADAEPSAGARSRPAGARSRAGGEREAPRGDAGGDARGDARAEGRGGRRGGNGTRGKKMVMLDREVGGKFNPGGAPRGDADPIVRPLGVTQFAHPADRTALGSSPTLPSVGAPPPQHRPKHPRRATGTAQSSAVQPLLLDLDQLLDLTERLAPRHTPAPRPRRRPDASDADRDTRRRGADGAATQPGVTDISPRAVTPPPLDPATSAARTGVHNQPDAARISPLATDQAAAERLFARLTAFGLRGIAALRLTQNRSTLVSFRAGTLRLHAAFQNAPEEVLRAVAVFVSGRGAARVAARRVIVAYPIPRDASPRTPRRERVHPDDASLAERLTAAHDRLNRERFGGTLRSIPVTVSRRMSTRLGHYAPARSHPGGAEIAISRRHIRRHGWREAFDTLLHEMVHQWQEENGHPIDHGPLFRRKAREVGTTPRARRVLR